MQDRMTTPRPPSPERNLSMTATKQIAAPKQMSAARPMPTTRPITASRPAPWSNRLWALAYVLGMSLLSPQANAQAYEDEATFEQMEQWLAQVSVELIYPQAIAAGEPFVLHAYVHNGSDRVLNAGVWSTSRGFDGYVYRPCRYHCGGDALQPGESRYVTTGKIYYAEETLRHTPLVIDGLALGVSPASGGIPIPAPTKILDPVTVAMSNPDVPPGPNPALNPAPERQALMLADLRETGDELLIHDPNTGYDWIRLGATAGLTLENAEHALATEDYLQGFQLARASQIEQLLLNYLYAEGVTAHRLDLHAQADHELGVPIANFVHLFAQKDSAIPYALQGVTANEPGTWRLQIGAVASVNIYGFEGPPQTGSFRQSIGYMPLRLPLRDEQGSPWKMPGFWLVRGAPGLVRPTHNASYLDEELVIPVLTIGDDHYRAALISADPDRGMFRVISLTALSPTEGVQPADETSVFDEDTGLLTLSDAVLIQAHSTANIATLTFRLVADTEPPAFELIGLVEK